MSLTPSKLDPNYEAEKKRMKDDPLSFGMPKDAPAPSPEVLSSGKLSPDRVILHLPKTEPTKGK